MNANGVRADHVKEQIRDMERRGISWKVIKRYKGLIERFPDCRRKEVVAAKSPMVINIFRSTLKEESEEKTIEALEVLGKIIENFAKTEQYGREPIRAYVHVPFENMMNVLNSYLSLIVRMGEISTFAYVDVDDPKDNERVMDEKTFVLILNKSFGKMKDWDFDFQEQALAKIGMMQWTLGSTAITTLRLNENGVKELDKNGIIMLHPTWNGIVDTYMERGFNALSDGTCERGMIVATAFERLDNELAEHIKRNYDDPELAKAIIDINTRLSGLLSNGVIPPYEVVSHFISRGLEGVENIMKREKEN